MSTTSYADVSSRWSQLKWIWLSAKISDANTLLLLGHGAVIMQLKDIYSQPGDAYMKVTLMSITRRQFFKYLAVIGTYTGSNLLTGASYSALPTATMTTDRLVRVIPYTEEKIPAIGLGSWLTFAIDLDDEVELSSRVAILREFLKLGGGMLDSSPMYGVAEEVIGIGLNRIGHQKGLFSATMVWTKGNRVSFLQMEYSRMLWGFPGFDLM